MTLMHNFQQKKELLCSPICTLVEIILFGKDPDFVVFISLLVYNVHQAYGWCSGKTLH